jgi:glycosyltransferase involved in cell wall biosynthesis
LQEIAAAGKFDLIYVHLIRMAEYIDALNGEPKILDLTDAMSLSYERICRIHRDHRLKVFHVAQKVESRRLRRYEAAAVKKFDRNLIISQSDKTFLGKFADVSNMKIIGPGVNVEYFSFHQGAHDARRIVFLGTMSFLPNVDAVRYFYQTMWPSIQQRLPGMKLVIVGANPAPEILALKKNPDIEVTGYVPDVRPYLRNAAVSICPMRVGAGAKNKVLEAMAIGTPVVSTSLGIEGIEAQPGHHLLVADTPQAFTRQVCDIAQDSELRARLARQARRLIEQKYDWNLVVQPLQRMLESLLSK